MFESLKVYFFIHCELNQGSRDGRTEADAGRRRTKSITRVLNSTIIVVIEHDEHFEFFQFLRKDSCLKCELNLLNDIIWTWTLTHIIWAIWYGSFDIIYTEWVIWIHNSTANFPAWHPDSRPNVPTIAIFTQNIQMSH